MGHRFWRRSLKGFYHICALRPSWSCDPDAANKISFPLTKEAPHQNLALIGKSISGKKIFEHCERRRTTTTDDGWTPDHEYSIGSPISLWLR